MRKARLEQGGKQKTNTALTSRCARRIRSAIANALQMPCKCTGNCSPLGGPVQDRTGERRKGTALTSRSSCIALGGACPARADRDSRVDSLARCKEGSRHVSRSRSRSAQKASKSIGGITYRLPFREGELLVAAFAAAQRRAERNPAAFARLCAK